MRILLSNDDGVHAPGLHILYKELSKFGQVKVVAPLEEKSTTGHSLTLHKPLRLIPMKPDFYGVSGSPADCVYVGIKQVWKRMPDIVVSGINRGANLGQDIYYSGTVSAAREGCMLGIPSFAISLHVDFGSKRTEDKLHYLTAAKSAAKFIKDFMKSKKMPKHTMININVPDVPMSKIKGVDYTRQGFRHYSGSVVKRTDHRGKDYFWVGGQYLGFEPDTGTDCTVVDQGYVSVSPLKLDVTDMSYLAELKQSTSKRKKR